MLRAFDRLCIPTSFSESVWEKPPKLPSPKELLLHKTLLESKKNVVGWKVDFMRSITKIRVTQGVSTGE